MASLMWRWKFWYRKGAMHQLRDLLQETIDEQQNAVRDNKRQATHFERGIHHG